ncbi:MAG: YdhR family protein [Acidobacteria bacterium]|nr:YdhR family protein [Acidobacteriota bacterium]
MTERVLQLNFRVKAGGNDYQAAVAPLADAFAAVPGLRWKIWYQKNEAAGEAGGIYLFEDQASLDKFLASDLAAKVTGHPALSDFSIKQFDVMEKETLKTRGPVGAKVAV